MSQLNLFVMAKRSFLALVLSLSGSAGSFAQSGQPAPLGWIKSWGYQLPNLEPARLASVPYDAIVIDYSRDGSDQQALTPSELTALKRKPDGSRRVVLAYLSIGEAESYRYYWNETWDDLWFIPNFWSKPAWRAKLNGDWGGNYAVRYWDPGWQDIIVGSGGYLDRIVKAGFDGVWLDKVDSSLEDIADGRATAKADMIAFVKRIADTSRAAKPGFLIFPQNGELLLSDPGYRAMIDGIGKESLLFGEEAPGKANTPQHIAQRTGLLQQLTRDGKPVLTVEYLSKTSEIVAARARHVDSGFVPHFADQQLASMRIGDYPDLGEASASRRQRRADVGRWSTGLGGLLAAIAASLLLGFLIRRWRKG